MAVSQVFLSGALGAKVVAVLGVVSLAASLAACDRSKDADKAKQAAVAPPSVVQPYGKPWMWAYSSNA